jgi:hypothetical protein
LLLNAASTGPDVNEWLEKVSQPSLAEPFGSDKGVNRINSRLSFPAKDFVPFDI